MADKKKNMPESIYAIKRRGKSTSIKTIMAQTDFRAKQEFIQFLFETPKKTEAEAYDLVKILTYNPKKMAVEPLPEPLVIHSSDHHKQRFGA